jgi:3',5'-cyclic AMP phosphodiesterase CpdA
MKTIRQGFRAAVIMGAASILVFASGAMAQNNGNGRGNGDGDGNPNSSDNAWPYAATPKSPVLAVVGDVACQPGAEGPGEAGAEVCADAPAPYVSTSLWKSQEATANQIEAMKPDAVALTGDLQYQVGRYSDFEGSFDLTYGAFKFLHRPSPGNHEFYDEHGQTGVAGYGYFSYYNGFMLNPNGSLPLVTISDPCPVPDASCKAGKTPTIDLSAQPVPRPDGQAGHFEASGGLQTVTPGGGPDGVGDGWYSYNLGSWHLISLNIQCYTQPGGCNTNGTWLASELAWLQKDLEENHAACTAAYWHQPTFSATNGLSQEGATAQAFWQLLYQHNADLVLNGHDHLYARYRPLDPSGNYDPQRGIREFIVGTGGETLDAPVAAGAAGETSEDPGMHTNFNKLNLENATGDFWGVMALTLDKHGYKWDFESAPGLQGPVNNGQVPNVVPTGSYSDKGFGTCHNQGKGDGDDRDN